VSATWTVGGGGKGDLPMQTERMQEGGQTFHVNYDTEGDDCPCSERKQRR